MNIIMLILEIEVIAVGNAALLMILTAPVEIMKVFKIIQNQEENILFNNKHG